VDKLTPEEVEEGNKKFAWRKTKPSDQMGFKEDDSGLIYHRHLHGTNERL
jgi:hypothetical protein